MRYSGKASTTTNTVHGIGHNTIISLIEGSAQAFAAYLFTVRPDLHEPLHTADSVNAGSGLHHRPANFVS